MTDHRRLQRTLFRMQHDADFAARLRAEDADAVASTGLAPGELAWLRAADPRALAADREGRRSQQLLESVTSEFALTTHPAVARTLAPSWPRGFAASPEFHAAVSGGTSLPLAFGVFAARRAREAGSVGLAALAALEGELARARRLPGCSAAPAPGCVVRSPEVSLLVLPQGSFALATALRTALDAGAAPAPSALRGLHPEASECVMVHALGPARAHRLREARAERLEPLVADLLRAAQEPLDAAARRRFAAQHGLDAAEVEAVVSDFAGEAVLVAG